MDYEACKTLEELINDSNATEFRDNIEYMPFGQTEEQFFTWLNTDALPSWGQEYQPMLQTLGRLVKTVDYTLAMAELKKLQDQLTPAPVEIAAAEPEELEKPQEVPAPVEVIPAPKEAAKKVVEEVAAQIIKEFQEENPGFVAKLIPGQLSEAAMDGTAAAVVSRAGNQ